MRQRQKRNDDPWRAISAPADPGAINARRIRGLGTPEWGLYWGVDGRKQCLLILQHRCDIPESLRLPRLRGLLVDKSKITGRGGRRIIIRLTASDQREIFYRFCVDVRGATRLAKTEDEAIGRFINRTWRWHRLLRSGLDGRLSDQEQQGLIGELRFLQGHLLPLISTLAAVESWSGPLGNPKDFQVGLSCVEVKAPNPQKSTISISSIDQLDTTGLERLFVYVSEVAAAPVDSTSCVTITEAAKRVGRLIEESDVSAAMLYEERLRATGLDLDDDYSDSAWEVGREQFFEVTEGFPRLTPTTVPVGVESLRYTISLAECAKFSASKEALTEAMLGIHDGS